MNLLDPSTITVISSTALMREKCRELQYNGFYIDSLEPTIDNRVQIVAKQLRAGMHEQSIHEVDFKGFWLRRAEFIKKFAEENKKKTEKSNEPK